VELEGLALRHRSLIIRAVMAWSACGAGRTDTHGIAIFATRSSSGAVQKRWPEIIFVFGWAVFTRSIQGDNVTQKRRAVRNALFLLAACATAQAAGLKESSARTSPGTRQDHDQSERSLKVGHAGVLLALRPFKAAVARQAASARNLARSLLRIQALPLARKCHKAFGGRTCQ
jgi:hypothetical protein